MVTREMMQTIHLMLLVSKKMCVKTTYAFVIFLPCDLEDQSTDFGMNVCSARFMAAEEKEDIEML